jgi:SAM-dependent methyltransferase
VHQIEGFDGPNFYITVQGSLDKCDSHESIAFRHASWVSAHLGSDQIAYEGRNRSAESATIQAMILNGGNSENGDVRNHWHWIRRWDPKAQESVDWACAQYPLESRQRGVARGYYEFLWNADEIVKTIPQKISCMKVMDVGCGAGVVALAMRRLGAEVTAVDRFDEYQDDFDNLMGSTADIVSCLNRSGVVVRQCDVMNEELPGEPESFDLITCFAMIEHLHESPAALFKAMHRRLRPGGYLVITTPNHGWIRNRVRLLFGRTIHFPIEEWWQIPFYGHVREFTMGELISMFRWSGFEIRRHTIGNWIHLASRIRSVAPGKPERWTTRFTLNSPERLMVAMSLATTAFFPSLHFNMLVIGQKAAPREEIRH